MCFRQYASLFEFIPNRFCSIGSSTATVTVNGSSQQSQIGITGQYYNLGYYPKDTTVNFKVKFLWNKAVSFLFGRNSWLKYQCAFERSHFPRKKGVDLTTGKRSASGTFTADKISTVTTIPYGKVGVCQNWWQKLPIKALKDALLSVPVSAGTPYIRVLLFTRRLIPGMVVIRFYVLVVSLPTANPWFLLGENRKKEDK